MSDRLRPLQEHLYELRQRLIRVLAVFAAGFILSWLPAPSSLTVGLSGVDLWRVLTTGGYEPICVWLFNNLILSALPQGVKVALPRLLAPLYVAVMMSLMIATFFAIPALLREAYGFVRPGLRENEVRLFKMYFLSSGILFTIGLIFGYLIVFRALMWLYSAWSQMYEPERTITFIMADDLINDLIMCSLGSGLLFLTPTVMAMLSHLDLVRPESYARNRVPVYPVALIVICALTPDPTIVTSSIWFLTFVALYEAGILLSKHVYRKYVLPGNG